MIDKLIISGFGGQGVMFLGKVLAYAGMDAGLELCWIPSYGPEMRGGAANCSVIFSDREIYSTVVDYADSVIALSKPAYDKFISKVKPGGVLILNSSLVKIDDDVRKDIEIIIIPATEIAKELGSQNIANMVCLGALIPRLKLIDYQGIAATIAKLSEKRPQLAEINLKAVQKGLEYIKRD